MGLLSLCSSEISLLSHGWLSQVLNEKGSNYISHKVVQEWMRTNKLKLNPNKPSGLVGERSYLGFFLDGVVFPFKGQVHSLGVLLNPGLMLDKQVAAVGKNAFRQLRPLLGRTDLVLMMHALVTCKLDSCNAHYVGLPLKNVWRLEVVQNAEAKMLAGVGCREHITSVLARDAGRW